MVESHNLTNHTAKIVMITVQKALNSFIKILQDKVTDSSLPQIRLQISNLMLYYVCRHQSDRLYIYGMYGGISNVISAM